MVAPMLTVRPCAPLTQAESFGLADTTLPLTFLTLASLVCAWQDSGRERAWWLAAATITLVERIATFGFFIPTAIKLVRMETSAAQASSLARQWQPANVVRISLNLMAWLLALKALLLLA